MPHTARLVHALWAPAAFTSNPANLTDSVTISFSLNVRAFDNSTHKVLQFVTVYTEGFFYLPAPVLLSIFKGIGFVSQHGWL